MPSDSSSDEAVPTSLVDFIDDVNSNPRSGIHKAFRLVRKALDESYPELASITQDRLSDAIEDLVRRGALHEDVANAISQLRKLLEMSDSDANMVDPARGYLFLMLAEGAIHGILRSAKIHANKITDARLTAGLTPIRSSWQGRYNRGFIIELHIAKWSNDTEFEGEMNYPGSGTVTSVNGSIIPTGPGSGLKVAWRERDYVRRGERSIDFDGDYRATISGDVMAGGWYTDEQLIGEFELEAIKPGSGQARR